MELVENWKMLVVSDTEFRANRNLLIRYLGSFNIFSFSSENRVRNLSCYQLSDSFVNLEAIRFRALIPFDSTYVMVACR